VAREPPLFQKPAAERGFNALAIPELGSKQICPTCSAKFYDLNKRPAHCPKCGDSFDPEEALKSRRVRARSAAPDYEDAEEKPEKPVVEDADGFEDEVDETPEIDQAVEADVVETDEDGDDVTPAAAPAEDLGVDFAEDELAEEESDDVPFLEDEDEDDFAEDDIEGLPGEGEDDT
jgi:uncharacterized protein (TIGR02300 family)